MTTALLGGASSIQSSLPILLDAALKGAILVAAAGVAAHFLRNRAAASRHALWTAAVIGHLTIPALALILPAWNQPLLPAAPWMQAPVNPPATPNDGVVSGSTAGITTKSASPKATSSAEKASLPAGYGNSTTGTAPVLSSPTSKLSVTAVHVSKLQVLSALWLVGALLVLLRLAIGTWRVSQLAREGARVEDGLWLSLTQRLANRLGVSRPLTLLRGERLAVPVTWGIVYPAVLLPEDADTWSEERRRFVLVHEMAHVKRFDALTQLIAQLSIAIFWFDPLVWYAAHRMRVEREHACDDYVIRDGTRPSLYAGELLEMVQSIGTRERDNTGPAFAALAMARRSEFEGRMLAILDPKLDRHGLNGRGALMTAVIVALLTFPLAAWRPFQQPVAARDEFPTSFKIAISEPASAGPATSSADAIPNSAVAATTAKSQIASQGSSSSQKAWTCEAYPVGTVLHGTSTHIDAHEDGSDQSIRFLVNEPGRCTEAAIIGKLEFSPDETRITGMPAGGFARFRERTSAADRAVSVTSTGDGSLNYVASLNGRTTPFDGEMQSWLAGILPEVLREAGINVPERVARLRSQGGVPAVLKMIAQIRSTGAKRSHYEALIDSGHLSVDDVEKIAVQAPKDLAGSSGDLSAVIQKLPRSAMQSSAARRALADALPHISSSGDRANTLQLLAPNADPEMLVLLAKAAEDLPSSGDKANFLIASAARYLSGGNSALANAFFSAAATVPSSGDLANVLITALPYGHANPAVTPAVIETSKHLTSSGDIANVLIDLISQRVIRSDNTSATRAVINRTLSMASSGDRANVLIELAQANLLSTRELRDEFIKAANALPSEGDRANVLAAAAQLQ
jgi:beta-lactamase regulating signal transducer with metallopeptidase domain